jgi:hypothetical protein
MGIEDQKAAWKKELNWNDRVKGASLVFRKLDFVWLGVPEMPVEHGLEVPLKWSWKKVALIEC